MKPTDFSYYLSFFLTKYLSSEVGASNNTIASYRDTFILFLIYLKEEKKVSAEHLLLNMITKDIVIEFLN